MDNVKQLAEQLLASLTPGDWTKNVEIIENFLRDLHKKRKEPSEETPIEKFYDKKGNADHYNNERINCMIACEQLWGTKNLMAHYECSIFEYRFRMGKKDTDTTIQELMKIKWYQTAAQYLFSKIGTPEEVIGLDISTAHPLPEKFQQLLNK